ncbi:hypothetical protein BDP27DRAFT_1425431 [Rhodocollybia butyracea]|uniref:Uncharacterized protein n=1 Tax=Rhodocollybia butyracea TaxID=206335 RepID=A0A9P5PMP8_9AGAR|nr:hypothetical protein BDP27DRAFT_1425431 [Rhodocollybia butyracea]
MSFTKAVLNTVIFKKSPPSAHVMLDLTCQFPGNTLVLALPSSLPAFLPSHYFMLQYLTASPCQFRSDLLVELGFFMFRWIYILQSMLTVLSTSPSLSFVIAGNINAYIYLPHLPLLMYADPTCTLLQHMYTLVYNLLLSSSTTVALYFVEKGQINNGSDILLIDVPISSANITRPMGKVLKNTGEHDK